MIRSPIFIIGCPRSGTSLLYTLLAETPSLWSIGGESKAIIERYHHPAVKGWTSGELDAADVTPLSRAAIPRAFERQAAPGDFWRAVNRGRAQLRANRLWRALKQRGQTVRPGATAAYAAPQAGLRLAQALARARNRLRPPRQPIHLLEKTPENCLRLPFLLEIFPDARFIFLTRDAFPNIASLLEGWRQPHLFPGYAVPEPVRIPGDRRGRWAFTLIPGWRELLDRPLVEVCARQWVACNEAMLAYQGISARRLLILNVLHEDLLRDPARELKRIGEFVGEDSAEFTRQTAFLPEINAVSRPNREKWRQFSAELDQVADIIEPTRRRLGYA